ncbi:hypothetical protein TELCIR_07963 [Teladorsagia circumcincta]|uniref:Peptidase S9 prolyl oligopeptidase catalytic domain-containing protein n=1 Tax=Teladorsagia circumcincta TaxID=45464 RepID=A0A2G9UIX4_TELCI|nr:hypothetical protein TELCIR_07963 [Teladorsagia circumcincta]
MLAKKVKFLKKKVSYAMAELALNPRKKTAISERAGVQAEIIGMNSIDRRIIVGLNDENTAYSNLYSFDLLNDSMTLIMKNTLFPKSDSYEVFILDDDLNVRLANKELSNGSVLYYRTSSTANPLSLTSNLSDWEEYLLVDPESTAITKPLAFDDSGKNMYWLWPNENSDLGSLVIFPFDDVNHRKILYSPKRGEISVSFYGPTIVVVETFHKPETFCINNTGCEDIKNMQSLRSTDTLRILSRSEDGSIWMLTYLETPYDVFIYRREVKKIELLHHGRPGLTTYKLSRQIGFTFETRDHMLLQAYLSLPPEIALRDPKDVSAEDREYAELGMLPMKPQKMIVAVHGGPQNRDRYTFSPRRIWLANRGYAVLQVNFRGSTGFGKRYKNAGNGEWSRKMHYDILDGVEFTIAKGIANRTQVAILGEHS